MCGARRRSGDASAAAGHRPDLGRLERGRLVCARRPGRLSRGLGSKRHARCAPATALGLQVAPDGTGSHAKTPQGQDAVSPLAGGFVKTLDEDCPTWRTGRGAGPSSPDARRRSQIVVERVLDHRGGGWAGSTTLFDARRRGSACVIDRPCRRRCPLESRETGSRPLPATICDKAEAAKLAVGPIKPSPKPPAVVGQGRCERNAMLGYAPPARHGLRDGQPDGDHERLPTELGGCNSRRKPPLSIEGPEELADVHDRGLELDHEDDPSGGVPRQEVDDPTLAVDRERDFGPNRPAATGSQATNDVLGEGGMAGVDRSIEVGAVRARLKLEPDIQGGGDAPDRPQRQAVEIAPLHPADDDVGRAGKPTEVDLPQRSSQSQRAEGDTPTRRSSIGPVCRGRLTGYPTERAFDMMAATGRAGGQPTGSRGQACGGGGRPGPDRGRGAPEACTSSPRSWTSSTVAATTCSDAGTLQTTTSCGLRLDWAVARTYRERVALERGRRRSRVSRTGRRTVERRAASDLDRPVRCPGRHRDVKGPRSYRH